MKLNSPDWILFVFYAHDFPFIGLGRDLKALGQRVGVNNQGMIAGRGEGIRHAREEIFAVVFDG